MNLTLAQHVRDAMLPHGILALGSLAGGVVMLAMTVASASRRLGPRWVFRLAAVLAVIWFGLGAIGLSGHHLDANPSGD